MNTLDIGAAILMGIIVVMMIPRIVPTLKESRKGSQAEWMNVLLLIGGVMLFVWVLMKAV